MPILLALFIITPIAEMWVLIQVGIRIGALSTIGLVFLTAVIGLALLRQQGLSTLFRANQRMQAGQLPAQEMGEGIFLAIGGALLLTPGFITDVIGFSCLIPTVRQWMIGRFLKRRGLSSAAFFETQTSQGSSQSSSQSSTGASSKTKTQRDDREPGRVIEGEYRRDD